MEQLEGDGISPIYTMDRRLGQIKEEVGEHTFNRWVRAGEEGYEPGQSIPKKRFVATYVLREYIAWTGKEVRNRIGELTLED